MLQRKCPQRNQLPRQIAPRHPGNRAADAVAAIVADADGGVPRHPFQLRSNRCRLNR
jgi:hypothetical protein